MLDPTDLEPLSVDLDLSVLATDTDNISCGIIPAKVTCLVETTFLEGTCISYIFRLFLLIDKSSISLSASKIRASAGFRDLHRQLRRIACQYGPFQ